MRADQNGKKKEGCKKIFNHFFPISYDNTRTYGVGVGPLSITGFAVVAPGVLKKTSALRFIFRAIS